MGAKKYRVKSMCKAKGKNFNSYRNSDFLLQATFLHESNSFATLAIIKNMVTRLAQNIHIAQPRLCKHSN